MYSPDLAANRLHINRPHGLNSLLTSSINDSQCSLKETRVLVARQRNTLVALGKEELIEIAT
jgi:hypothetical protein